jgi:N6-L-threonylcarbamoyladenine synthase
MKILAIESSCDETAASVIEGRGEQVTVLSNIVSSQIEIHQKYGGVIPEVAAREHVLNILPVINEALLKAGIKPSEAAKKLSAIAVTAGPGLITSLSVGVETAKTLAYGWKLPLIDTNHIAGHIYANWILDESKKENLKSKKIDTIKFPAVIMTVSGGHNMLVLMKGHLDYEIIGDTLDDAAGEAFDKAAKMLELGYPGGPAVAAAAASIGNLQLIINNSVIKLPRPMISSGNFNFSFSGLKTALLYALKKDKSWRKKIPAYAAEYQQAIVDTLIAKTIKAAKKYQAKTVLLAGGVSANKELRGQLAKAVTDKLPEVLFGLPDLKYTTDNAAMIGAAAYFLARKKKYIKWSAIKTNPNLDLN